MSIKTTALSLLYSVGYFLFQYGEYVLFGALFLYALFITCGGGR